MRLTTDLHMCTDVPSHNIRLHVRAQTSLTYTCHVALLPSKPHMQLLPILVEEIMLKHSENRDSLSLLFHYFILLHITRQCFRCAFGGRPAILSYERFSSVPTLNCRGSTYIKPGPLPSKSLAIHLLSYHSNLHIPRY